MKVVINSCHGGFGLSLKARERYCEIKEIELSTNFYDSDIARDDPILVQVVEELGDLADNYYSELKIVDIPNDVNWYIEEYDGMEWVAERHRTWR